jgi:hypothetical protein
MATPLASRSKRRAALAARLRTEFNLDDPADCARAAQVALSGDAGPEILSAIRFRIARARQLPALQVEAARLAGVR